jgi:hypothetical protein
MKYCMSTLALCRELLPYVVALYEAKTPKALSEQLPKCKRQAMLEYLAINQMHSTGDCWGFCWYAGELGVTTWL